VSKYHNLFRTLKKLWKNQSKYVDIEFKVSYYIFELNTKIWKY